jgi:hypothetical protein
VDPDRGHLSVAVNTPPFVPVVRIYPGGNPVDPASWGAGVDISAKVRMPGSDGGAPITYSGGRPDEAAAIDPGRMTMTLDNRDGRFSTRNPNGPYYGLLRRGTPIMLSTQAGVDVFSRTVSGGLGTSSGGGVWSVNALYSTDGTSGQSAMATANLAAASFLADAGARDIDARMTVWPTVAATGAALSYNMLLRATDSANAMMFTIDFGVAGAIQVRLRRLVANVITDLGTTTLGSTYVANDKWRIRAQMIGQAIRIKAWKPANPALPDADEPAAWTLTGTDTIVTGTRAGLYFWRVAGNSNAGTVNMKVSDVVFEGVEFSGSVVEWPVRWNKTGANCWAPITAAGVLRRIRQGATQLRSPLYRQLSSYAPIAYWPLEDDSSATSFGSAVPGVASARGVNVQAGQDSTLAGTSVAPVMSAASASIRATSGRRQSGTGFSAMFLMRFPAALPVADTTIATFSCSGRITSWEIRLELAGPFIRMRGREPDGTIVVDTLGGVVGISRFDRWVAWQLEGAVTGGTVDMSIIWHEVGDAAFYAMNDSYSSSTAPRCYGAVLGGSSVEQCAYSHLWLGENTLPFVDNTFSLVSDGYRGEMASDRVARLCREEGVPAVAEPGTSDPLGPQRIGSFLDAVQQAADADYGILYETGVGLGYRPRSTRYNRPVAYALTVAAGDVAEAPEPTDDDQRVTNDFTASRIDGSSARVYDATHIAAEGVYQDSASLNVYSDDSLPDYAGWQVYLGTRPDLRWPSIEMNFARRPSLLTTWRTAPVAPRLTLVTGLAQVAAADPDVIVEGWEVTLDPFNWTVRMNCSPAKPWDMGALNSTVRLDTAGSTLDAAVTTTATSWTAVTTTGPIWAPTSILPAEVPFTITCEGEECSVTNVGDLSGGKQILTVLRSTNGIVKAHAAGAPLSLAVPTYLAL